MISGNSNNIVHKDVVIIGNGPSGIALSYMLSGNIPYLTSSNHPDEMLSARLHTVKTNNLIKEELDFLAAGIEGRTTNPISLLLDSLAHPFADIGLELDPLIEWRKDGTEIDHVVLGNGPPGGSWHKMDPCILTLSLGSWMALPGLPYTARDGSEKRASAGNVAQYYVQYVNEMNLTKYFKNDSCVLKIRQLNDYPSEIDDGCVMEEDADLIEEMCYERKSEHVLNKWVERLYEDECERTTNICTTPETENKKRWGCPLSRALDYIKSTANIKQCKRRRDDDLVENELSPDRKIREVLMKSISVDGEHSHRLISAPPYLCRPQISKNILSSAISCHGRSISLSCDFDRFKNSCDSLCSRSFSEQSSIINPIRNSYSLDFNSSITRVPQALNNCDNRRYGSFRLKGNCDPSTSSFSKRNKLRNNRIKWLIEAYDTVTGERVTYLCNNLVLASGASDLPNRLAITINRKDPSWLVHDVRSLELKLDNYMKNNPVQPDPVLIIGAGLSAADAIIATRCRNIPVLHLFRSKTSDFGKQLPENMYPEYHKVHQMMQDGGSTYPLYEALPEYTITEFNENEKTVKLTKNGKELKFNVSFAAVLIGARPDLSFLPQNFNLGLKKDLPVDNKTNNIDVNKLNHSVNGFEGLYAMGPLVGDNFVRFIPGGALAILSDLYKEYDL